MLEVPTEEDAMNIAVISELERQHIPYELLPHAPTKTAAAEAHALHLPLGEVAKTLVLATSKGYVRALVPASRRIDLEKVANVRRGRRGVAHPRVRARRRLSGVRAGRRPARLRARARRGGRGQELPRAPVDRLRGRPARRVRPREVRRPPRGDLRGRGGHLPRVSAQLSAARAKASAALSSSAVRVH